MREKVCKKCGVKKPINEFSKRDESLDGYRNECKLCICEYLKTYRSTAVGVVREIYNSQKHSSKKRGHELPSYTFEELKHWCFSQPNWALLYESWVESEYDRWGKPSIDRLDDSRGYSFSNIQLMTWAENKNKSHSDRKAGRLISSNTRAVIQLSMGNKFIAEYYSILEASRRTGINRGHIGSVCCGRPRYKSAGGYKWAYKN